MQTQQLHEECTAAAAKITALRQELKQLRGAAKEYHQVEAAADTNQWTAIEVEAPAGERLQHAQPLQPQSLPASQTVELEPWGSTQQKRTDKLQAADQDFVQQHDQHAQLGKRSPSHAAARQQQASLQDAGVQTRTQHCNVRKRSINGVRSASKGVVLLWAWARCAGGGHLLLPRWCHWHHSHCLSHLASMRLKHTCCSGDAAAGARQQGAAEQADAANSPLHGSMQTCEPPTAAGR